MIRFAITRDVQPPTRGTLKSAGYDLYIPNFTNDFMEDFLKYNPDHQQAYVEKVGATGSNFIGIWPHCAVYIPTGVWAEISNVWNEDSRGMRNKEGSALFVKNKGGVSFKQKLIKVAQVIDEDYQGEIFITLLNYSNKLTKLLEGQKFIQLVEQPVFYSATEIVPKSELYKLPSQRGEGKMGSTGFGGGSGTSGSGGGGGRGGGVSGIGGAGGGGRID